MPGTAAQQFKSLLRLNRQRCFAAALLCFRVFVAT
jgi:hypothetical protein